MEVRRACRSVQSQWQARQLTLFGKTVVILSAELALNALIWIIAVIVFTRTSTSQRQILPLALVAWTTGLRHGLDADHISGKTKAAVGSTVCDSQTVQHLLAIDNATRRIVSVPLSSLEGEQRIRRPVTVGLFFSLGHSTIVVATIIAIAISAGIADSLDGFGTIGSIIGPAISGSFLILIGCINSYILYQTWSRIQRDKVPEVTHAHTRPRFNGIMTRLAMPLLRTVDRPWKLYPVGLLFGLGFDTASSIALLSVAVIAQQNSGQAGGSDNSSVVLLAFLFTAGMTLVDSIDSCLMIWAYAPDLTSTGGLRTSLCEARKETGAATKDGDIEVDRSANETKEAPLDIKKDAEGAVVPATGSDSVTSPKQLLNMLDRPASQLSLVLTALSVVIAFVVGIIVLLGLIGDQCARCSRAADKQESSGLGGLEGQWWLTWRRANDNFGYVGAAIVGLFAVSVSAYFVARWVVSKRQRREQAEGTDAMQV